MHCRTTTPALWPVMALAVALSVPFLSGCAATAAAPSPDRFVSPSFVAPPPGSLLLLLHQPAMEAAYRPRDADVRQAVQDALVKAGYRVALIEPADHALALRAELQPLFQAASQPSQAELAQAELRALATVSRAASPLTGSPLLIRTRVLNRNAELWQTVARWDGVSRPIAFHGAQPGRWSGEIVGSGPGISIEAVAVGPDGRYLMKHYGGIALPFAATVTATPMHQPVLVPDPLSVPEQIREGVGIALSPLRGP